MTLWISRLRLSRTPGNAALRHLLDPDDPGAAMSAHHRLLWAAFADGPDRTRDFLWRAEGEGRFTTLSRRRPVPHDLFDPPESKPFEPSLAPGDRLRFLLRANATRTIKTGRLSSGGKEHKAHLDLVMDGLFPLPRGSESHARRDARMAIAQAKAVQWMDGQGARHGFAVPRVEGEDGPEPLLAVEDYSVRPLPGERDPRKGRPQFGVLDMSGVIVVTDPARLVEQLLLGFGRAKSYGCGLMLIRRA